MEPLQIPLSHIVFATNDFDEGNKIAAGGFGKVYSGYSQRYGPIAVKRLDHIKSSQGQREFMMEIQLLSAYQHENLVSLVGFCDQDGEKILVYKLESNGSLDKLLQREDLNWIQRLRICLDAAKGLKYLHHDVGPQRKVVHRDVKSSNILLDENMKAKISDFGLSKISPTKESCSFLISNGCGTMGYVDPEYAIYGILTEKSDVYSFGVVLFEVLCGRLALAVEYEDRRRFLSTLALYHFDKNTLHKIIYPNLQDQMDPDSLKTFSTIAYNCLTKGRKDRPSMSQIVEQLQRALDEQLAASSGDAALHQGLPTSLGNNMTLASSSSHNNPLSSFSQSWNYDVFLNFRGPDTRMTFVDHLYSALVQQGINTYLFDQILLPGKAIAPSMFKAIEESRIAVVVLSKNYASSLFCLDELSCILKCKEERGQIIMPVFYDVDPFDIRGQNREYGEALARHESRNKNVESWRKALTDVSNLSGWETQHMANGFRGEDTLKTFVDHLYLALAQKQIYTYQDEEPLPSLGKAITPSLLKAIEESRIAVIVLSKHYASSTLCLNELAYIMKCKNERGQIVMPIYYHIDPSQVRNHYGSYAEAFIKYEIENKDVGYWRKALADVGSLSGFVTNGPESKLVKEIVDAISYELLSK